MNNQKEIANIHLLLVEDNKKYLAELQEWLKIFGYQHIDAARNAAEADEKLSSRHYDLIVADMRMEKDDSGFEVIEQAQKRHISSVVIILTANETVGDCRKAFKLGAWDYIRKNERGNVFELLHHSIREAITAFNRRGNAKDKAWIEANLEELRQKYLGKYVAVINHSVIEAADTAEALKQQLQQRKLPLFLTVIEKIAPPDIVQVERLAGEIDRLQRELAKNARPVVYVEGKTDEAILNAAWQKLYGPKAMPFVIKNCDLLPDSDKGGAAGAGALVKLLGAVRADSPYVAIGIFDRDTAGIKAGRGLPKYFIEAEEIEAKVSQNNKSAAFLLPIPEGKEKYAEYENLSIEFYFSESALARRTAAGYGLELSPHKRKITVGQVVKEVIIEDDEAREIAGGKKTFAFEIVPELEAAEFEAFRHIFDKIERILEYLQPLIKIKNQ